MTAIFLSYRRKDSKSVTRRIFDVLEDWYTEEYDDIFIDIDKIGPAAEWDLELQNALEQSDVVLAIIGKKWLQGLSRQGDYPRREVAQALSMGIPVVPILVNGASLPSRARLPHGLKRLLRRQALPLTRANYEDQLVRLWVEIDKITNGLKSYKEVWLRYLLSANPGYLRSPAIIRQLAEKEPGCEFVADLSPRELESILDSLCDQGWLQYKEGESAWLYWYEPWEE